MKEIKSICYLLNQYSIFNNIDINHQIYVVFAFMHSANYYFQHSDIKSMELTNQHAENKMDENVLKKQFCKKHSNETACLVFEGNSVEFEGLTLFERLNSHSFQVLHPCIPVGALTACPDTPQLCLLHPSDAMFPQIENTTILIPVVFFG